MNKNESIETYYVNTNIIIIEYKCKHVRIITYWKKPIRITQDWFLVENETSTEVLDVKTTVDQKRRQIGVQMKRQLKEKVRRVRFVMTRGNQQVYLAGVKYQLQLELGMVERIDTLKAMIKRFNLVGGI